MLTPQTHLANEVTEHSQLVCSDALVYSHTEKNPSEIKPIEKVTSLQTHLQIWTSVNEL